MPLPLLPLIAAAQTVYGVVKAGKATKDFNDANKLRKPIEIPQELYKILNATESNASSGFDPETLQYLTSQGDRAFSSSLGTLQQMGGDANAASALFDQQLQSIFKTSAQNHTLQMENFSKYLGALDSMGNAKVARQVSEQDIIKDRIQAANANKQAAFKNIESGINTGIAAYSQSQMENLYGEDASASNNFSRPVTGQRNTFTMGNQDPTAPAPSIIRNGRTFNWNPYSQKYE